MTAPKLLVPGRKFGLLTVLKNLQPRKQKSQSLVQCDCGNTIEVLNNNLLRGRTKSCGCTRREHLKRMNASPKFKKAKSERMKLLHVEGKLGTLEQRMASRERLKHQRADPKFIVNQKTAQRMMLYARNRDPEVAKAWSERLKALNADPEFVRAKSERLKALNADPEFVKARLKRLKALNADPEFVRAKSERLKAFWASPPWDFLHNRALAVGKRPSWPEARFYGLIFGNQVTTIGFVAQVADTHGIQDGAYPALKIELELDGGAHHAFRDRRLKDATIDAARRMAGWTIVRETDESVLFLKTLALVVTRTLKNSEDY